MATGMSGSFDVIVVGGGPAGCAAAITCRQNGLTALVIEADGSPRDRPGETLHPGVDAIFGRLGVLEGVERAGFLRHTGHRVVRGLNSRFQPYGSDERGEWRGYQAIRRQLDAILIDRARELGATVRQSTHAVEPVVEGGRPVGVRTNDETFRAAFVVDAAGPVHWLQRHLGLALLQVSDPLIARFGWDDGAGDLPEFRVEGCGWRWEAPVGAARRAWVSVDLHGASTGGAGQGRDVTWRVVRPCAGAGYFLAGDAACVLDPASSHGVLRAMESGIRAGEAITGGPASIADYLAWMESWFCSDALALANLYADFVPAPAWLGSAREALRYIAMKPFF